MRIYWPGYRASSALHCSARLRSSLPPSSCAHITISSESLRRKSSMARKEVQEVISLVRCMDLCPARARQPNAITGMVGGSWFLLSRSKDVIEISLCRLGGQSVERTLRIQLGQLTSGCRGRINLMFQNATPPKGAERKLVCRPRYQVPERRDRSVSLHAPLDKSAAAAFRSQHKVFRRQNGWNSLSMFKTLGHVTDLD